MARVVIANQLALKMANSKINQSGTSQAALSFDFKYHPHFPAVSVVEKPTKK